MTATIANVEMAQAWSGPEGDDWARDWERYDRCARAHHLRLLEAAGDAEQVLDVGCGNGEVTRDLARRGAQVLGVDLSTPMLARARELATGLPGAEFVHADAQVHPFPPEAYDLVVSRFGAMFFGDRDEAFRNLGRATRPGGRIALVAWQSLSENPWLLAVRSALALGRDLPEPPPGAPGPFGLADPDDVRAMLARAGYDEVRLSDVRVPMWFGDDVDDAMGFLGSSGPVRGLLEGLGPEQQAEGRSRLRDAFAGVAGPEGVVFDSASWLITGARG